MADNPRIDELRKRLEKEPGSRLFAQLAEELRKSGELGEAIEVCRAGLEKQPGYWPARMTLGRALGESGDLEGARPEFEAVLKAAPDNILASRLLGESLEGSGDLPGAAKRYRAALSLAPGDKQVQTRLNAVEALLKAPPPAPAPAPPPLASEAPIPRVAAEESFELESASESFASRPVPPPEPEAEPVLVRGTPDFGAPEGVTAEPPIQTAGPAGAGPPVASVAPEPAALSAFDLDAGLPPVAPAVTEAAPPPAPSESPEEPVAELASSTLAELYFNQGFTDKAIDVYGQLLEREPTNERARSRAAELQALERHLRAEEQRSPAVAASAPQDPRAIRRAAIERTIARLEAMLAAVRRD